MEDKERKSRAGLAIRCQRLLLRYRLSNTKALILVALVGLIGLSLFVLPNESINVPIKQTSSSDGVADLIVSNKEQEYLKMERDLEVKKAELELKEAELKDLESQLQEKEEKLNKKLEKLNSNKDQNERKSTDNIDSEKRNAVKEVQPKIIFFYKYRHSYLHGMDINLSVGAKMNLSQLMDKHKIGWG